MLCILTGNIEVGKTRWLENLYSLACAKGINVAGVIAPGIWKEPEEEAKKGSSQSTKSQLKKVAITNMLLPQNEIVTVAVRKDGAGGANGASGAGGAANAKQKYKSKRWDFKEDAFEKVNSHFADLARSSVPALLIVDELGPKELEFGEGLSNAVNLLKAGPGAVYKNAIIVVRPHLVPSAEKLFANWGSPKIIDPSASTTDIVAALD